MVDLRHRKMWIRDGRWKNGKTGKYIMLSMVWDINVQEDTAIVVCKPIDGFFDAKGVYN